MGTQTDSKAPAAPVKRRISAAVRKAIDLRVKQGMTWLEAAREAGMSEAGIHKARKRIDVQAEIERVQALYIQEVEATKASHKARAFQVARHLMDNAKSEAVRMRAVEFFAGEAKSGPQVAVNIQQNLGGQGYEYAPPGAKIVDVTPVSGDSQSPADDPEPTDN